MNNKYNENTKIKGEVTAKFYKAGTIQPLLDSGKTLTEAIKLTSCIKTHKCKNLIVDEGFGLFKRNINPNGTNQFITYLALGTGTDTPDISDTVLTNEIVRSAIMVYEDTSTYVATLKTFFAAGISTYAFKEGGLFGGSATASVDSGQMVTHFLSDIDNSLGTWDIVFEYTLTFS